MTQASETLEQAAAANGAADEKHLKYYTASQWQLIWWRFLRHRMALNFAARADGVTIDHVIARLVAPYA